jgi:hypothetical protein
MNKRRLVFESPHVRAYATEEFSESTKPIALIIEYKSASPTHPGETIGYGLADLLPSGATAGQIIALLQAAKKKKGVGYETH